MLITVYLKELSISIYFQLNGSYSAGLATSKAWAVIAKSLISLELQEN